MTFADQLKSCRRELGLTWPEFSALLEVPLRTLIDWTAGKTVPLLVAQEGAIARLAAAHKRFSKRRLVLERLNLC